MNRTAALRRQLIVTQKRHFNLSVSLSRPVLIRHINRHCISPILSRQMRSMSAQAKVFPSTGFGLIETKEPIQEEDLPGYRADLYYPVQIGEILRGRYQITAKLGFGTGSTVWLCRDLEYDHARSSQISPPFRLIYRETIQGR